MALQILSAQNLVQKPIALARLDDDPAFAEIRGHARLDRWPTVPIPLPLRTELQIRATDIQSRPAGLADDEQWPGGRRSGDAEGQIQAGARSREWLEREGGRRPQADTHVLLELRLDREREVPVFRQRSTEYEVLVWRDSEIHAQARRIGLIVHGDIEQESLEDRR